MDRIARWVSIVVLLGFAAVPASPEEMPVDSTRQSSMFKRIFSYDKLLRTSEKIIVLIVGQSRDGADVEAVAAAFRSEGMYPAVVPIEGLNDDVTATLSPKAAVFYVMPDVDYTAVKELAAKKGFLTVSGLPSLVESGHVSVSVDLVGSRPQVVVNMPRLATEGHELSSDLLKLARVIR